MTWIKCSDRLPEEGKRVLTFDSEGLCDVDRIEPGTERQWEFAMSPHRVTHWSELPDPPKEDA